VFLISASAISQEYYTDSSKNRLASLIEYTESVLGTNDVVVNGSKYIPQHYNAQGNPYFLSDSFVEGSLTIDGKKYDQQSLLYNINTDKIILKTNLGDGTEVYLELRNRQT
jgi:hypothetical protein